MNAEDAHKLDCVADLKRGVGVEARCMRNNTKVTEQELVARTAERVTDISPYDESFANCLHVLNSHGQLIEI